MSGDRRAIIVGTGLPEALALAALRSLGLTIPIPISIRRDPMDDILAVSPIYDHERTRPANRMTRKPPVIHIDTPKPKGKRARRRARGKGLA